MARKHYSNRTFTAMIKNPDRVADDLGPLRHIAAIAQLGNVLCSNQKDKNDWKIRMLEAGMKDNLSLPDDWQNLSEEEKERRLDGAINCIK